MDEDSSAYVAARRGLVVVGALTAVLVAGGVAIGARPVGNADRAVQPAGPVTPAAQVVNHNDEPAFSRAAAGLRPAARPVWDTDTGTLRYLSSFSYGGCGANATTRYDDDTLGVDITPDEGEPGLGCTTEAGAVVVVIRGLEDQPRTVAVVDSGVRHVWTAIS
ncbi:hypothetical protein [Nocardioides aquiterrae]|uniref:Uncharacterized protein n=1 Tax=Nocardioides aquiterrae TaxID=203799 RepID=A0ABP4F4R5_9ACTN